ncbi:MAG: hypothetical protein ACTHU0_39640 [Kofleriaceae bacterium]
MRCYEERPKLPNPVDPHGKGNGRREADEAFAWAEVAPSTKKPGAARDLRRHVGC